MKNSIGIIALFLFAVLICFGMTGCFEKAANSGSTGDASTITVWTNGGHDKQFINSMIDKYNQTTGKDKGIKIDYIVKDGNINQMLELAFVSDQAPDLFSGGQMVKLAEEGFIAALNDLSGGQEMIDKFDSLIMELRHRINGRVYSLPRTTTTAGLIYNKDMFKAAGIVDENGEPTPPKTLDELRDYAKRLTNHSRKEYGIVFPAKWVYWFSADISQISAVNCGFISGYNPATGQYDFSGMIPIMKTYMAIKEDKSYFPGAESLDNDPARARFAEGGIGMKISFSYDVGVLTDQFPAKIAWGVAPVPVADENRAFMQYRSNDAYLKINKKSVEKIGDDKLMEVFRWFYSDELLIESYKKGIDIPYDFNMIKDVETDGLPNGWKEFAQMVPFSKPAPIAMPTDVSGERGASEVWLDIWGGKIPVNQIEQTFKNIADYMNEGIIKYQKLHPEFDPSHHVIKDWDASR